MRTYGVLAFALLIASLGILPAEPYLLYQNTWMSGTLLPRKGSISGVVKESNDQAADVDDDNDVDLNNASEILSGPRIDQDGRIINKKRKLYSYGELEHVDDFFVGKYKVQWLVRGIKEKIRFRRRDSGSPPLRTSRFTFAGIGGFIIKLWLDGIYESNPGHIALSLVQQEHWSSLNSPLFISAGKVKRGPFFFRSSPYFEAIKSFCSLEEAVENNTMRIVIGYATR